MKTGEKPKLLIVDDDPLITETMCYLLKTDYDVLATASREAAKQIMHIATAPPQIALVDLGLPPDEHSPDQGFALISELLAHDSHMKILVLSGQDDRVNIQHALTLGAIDFIPKPCNIDLLKSRLSHQRMLLEAEAREVKQHNKTQLIGSSPVMQALTAQIRQFADAPFPVLIEGDSGTGKELVAQKLHEEGKRSLKPYFAINCAVFTKDLLEVQLFGHARGAFTGAMKEHAGFFEISKDGTLFLDEIGELPLELQAKLLRVLENNEYYRLGETKSRTSRARIIAATNKNMAVEVRAGRFRQDLYHRLSILTIRMPSLQERSDDCMELYTYFKEVYAGTVPSFKMDESAEKCWRQYAFPGNVRELRNLVIRIGTKYPGATISAKEIITEVEHGENPDCFSNSLELINNQENNLKQLNDKDFYLEQYLMSLEKNYVTAALTQSKGNLSQAAKLLKMNRTTLYSRLDKLGLR